jgi:AcrR family transcriptional regulator
MQLVIQESKRQTALPAIMRTAVRLFVAKGFEATTIKDIARGAGVAEGALYRHFPSKEALAKHLFFVNLESLTGRVAARVAAAAGARKRLRAYVESVFLEYERDPDLFYFLILSEHRELKAGVEHPGLILDRLVAEGQASRDFAPGEPMLLVSTVFGTLHRLCILRKYGRVDGPLTRFADEVSTRLFRALKA